MQCIDMKSLVNLWRPSTECTKPLGLINLPLTTLAPGVLAVGWKIIDESAKISTFK